MEQSINSNAKKSDILTKEQIIENVNKMKEGNLPKQERDTLFNGIWFSVKAYIVSVLNNAYPTYYVSNYEEMLQEAAINLFTEIPKYDETKGAFLTFIRPIIIHAGQEFINSSIHHTTAHYGANINKIKKNINQMMALGFEITPYTVAKRAGIPIHTVIKCFEQMNFADTVHIESQDFLGDVMKSLASDEKDSPENVLLRKEEKEAIQKYLSKLPAQTRDALLYKYGFKTGEDLPDSKVAELMKITKNQVRRLINAGHRTLALGLEKEQIFSSRLVRREIEECSKQITFIPKTTPEDMQSAEMFLDMNEVGF